MMNSAAAVKSGINFDEIRKHFPVLHQDVNDKPLVYLDNAASSQMPEIVADRIHHYHTREHANVHRGIHTLSQRATDEFEKTRKLVQQFINAASSHEVVLTTGRNDAINLVENSYVLQNLNARDEIILNEMEQHANIVPWQMIAEKTGAEIKVIPVLDSGDLDMEAYKRL